VFRRKNMQEIRIKAEIRKGHGKSIVKKLRKDGKIPAVLYGRDIQPVPITIYQKDWDKLGKHLRRNIIMNMEISSGVNVESRPVMIKEIQTGYLNDKILHIDFLQVSMERTIEVEIPIHLVGKPKGVIDGGIIEQHLRSIRIECLPTQIPEKIDIDVTGLEIGDSFHVQQINLPGVKLLEGSDVAIVTVTPPAVEEVAKPAVEEEVEVERIEKPEKAEKTEKAEKPEKAEKAEKKEG